MVAAIAADMEIGFEVARKQHLLASRAFLPEIVRHRLLGDNRPDLRQDEIGQPIHRRLVAGRRLLVEPGCHRSTTPLISASYDDKFVLCSCEACECARLLPSMTSLSPRRRALPACGRNPHWSGRR